MFDFLGDFEQGKNVHDDLVRSRFRLILVVSVVFHNLWGLILYAFFPTAIDPAWLRILSSGLGLGLWWIDIKYKIKFKVFAWAYIAVANAMVVHVSYLVSESHNHFIYVLGWFITLFIFGLTFDSWVFLLVQSATNFICFFFFLLNTEPSIVPIEIVAILVLTSTAITMATLADRLRYISELKRMIDEVHTKSDEVAQQKLNSFQIARLASLGEMVTGIAHEFNNPLAIIEGYVHGLKKDSPRPQALPTLEKISATVFRMSSVIGSLQRISGRSLNSTSNSIEPFSINELIMDVVAINTEKFRSSEIQVAISIPPEKVLVHGNHQELGQVLLNLLTNSYDAVTKVGDRLIRISAWTKANRSFLTVEDSGAGIPAGLQGKVFEPFFTTKEIGSGTGLGLSISKRIIENHGGRFYFDQNSLMTRFVIELPAFQEARITIAS